MVNGYLKNTEIKQGHKQKWYKKRFGFLSFLMFFQSTFYYNKGYNLPSKKRKKKIGIITITTSRFTATRPPEINNVLFFQGFRVTDVV